jgi:ssDNA thymidine ADP-ribosyltransferase, DarT
VNRSDVREFHYIASLENAPSIMERGILSYSRAQPLRPVSFALDTAQFRRARKLVAMGRTVHDYANVYFDAHNPTLSRCRDLNGQLAVLRVSPEILDIPATFIATKNAAASGVDFIRASRGLAKLDYERVYAEFWLHGDLETQAEWSRAKCAEVLVPDRIPPEYITGAYVCSVEAAARLALLAPGLPATVHRRLFF